MIDDKSPGIDRSRKVPCHLRIGMPSADRFALNLFHGQAGIVRDKITALAFIRFQAFLDSGIYPCIRAFVHQHTRAINEL